MKKKEREPGENSQKDLSESMIRLLETMLANYPLVRTYIVQPVFNQEDISLWQYIVLNHLAEKENISMSELAKDISLSTQQLNVTVRALEKRNLVERTTRKENRRFTDIKCTARGKKYLQQKQRQKGND